MRILCIDDDLIMLETLKEELKNKYRNAKVEAVSNFNDVMMCAYFYKKNNLKFDVIICDFLMPKIKGDAILKHLDEMFPDSVKILLSGEVNDLILKHMKDSIEKLYFIEKPWKINDLESAINDGITDLLNYEDEQLWKTRN